MVASLCGFGHKSPKRILPSTDQELKSDQQDVHLQRPDTLTESIFKCMKPRCSWSIAKKKKIQPNLLHHQQQQQPAALLKNDSNNNGSFKTRNHHQVATLEDWILASPGPNDFKHFRQSLSSSSTHKKVYPSSSSTDIHGRKSSSLSRRRLTVEGVLNGADTKAEDYSSTSFTSQSGKIKKKVSFRLPEVADIFILELDDPLPH